MVKKVTKVDVGLQNKLADVFPTIKSNSLPKVFDPMERCVALPTQPKKKSPKVKAVAVNVVLLPANVSIPVTIPKSKNHHQ